MSLGADAEVTVEALRTVGSPADLIRATQAAAARSPGQRPAGHLE